MSDILKCVINQVLQTNILIPGGFIIMYWLLSSSIICFRGCLKYYKERNSEKDTDTNK